MTDDIVTRLRIETASQIDVITRLDKECLCCPCCEESCLYCETVGELTEAADEIERLRDKVARLESFLHPIGVVINAYKGEKYDEEKIVEIVRKAVRHDES